MTGQDEGRAPRGFNFYGPQYARFDSDLEAELRREVYGADLGRSGDPGGHSATGPAGRLAEAFEAGLRGGWTA